MCREAGELGGGSAFCRWGAVAAASVRVAGRILLQTETCQPSPRRWGAGAAASVHVAGLIQPQTDTRSARLEADIAMSAGSWGGRWRIRLMADSDADR